MNKLEVFGWERASIAEIAVDVERFLQAHDLVKVDYIGISNGPNRTYACVVIGKKKEVPDENSPAE